MVRKKRWNDIEKVKYTLKSGEEIDVPWWSTDSLKDRVIETKHIQEVEAWIKMFGLEKGATVLDFGCGFGARIHAFVERGIDAVGVENDPFRIDNAYFLAEGRILDHIPIGQRFDLLICIDVLEHIGDRHIYEILTALKQVSDRALFGITTIDSHNFDLSEDHINGKLIEDWGFILSIFYKKVIASPQGQSCLCLNNEEDIILKDFTPTKIVDFNKEKAIEDKDS